MRAPLLASSPGGAASPDVQALERALRAAVRGEVRFDEGSRALYATDASNYRQVPIGVVIPRDEADVLATVQACQRHHAPLLSRGAGTSLCGQCCNVAVVMDFSKYMNRVLEIDAQARTARVQPGVVLDDLRRQAQAHGLTFAPDPATHNHNTLGGMVGNNSCGPHSVMGGETVHNVIELDVLTAEGLRMTVGATDEAAFQRIEAEGGRRAEIYRALRELAQEHAQEIRARFPEIPRRVSGYNLPWLLPERGFDIAKALVGSEGTCVVVLQALLRLLPDPPARVLLVLGYDSVYEAGDHVPEVMAAAPIALEGVDDRLVHDMTQMGLHPAGVRLLPEGQGWLLVEFGGQDEGEACGRARALMERLRTRERAPSMTLVQDPDVQAQLWKVREAGLGATAHVPNAPLTWEGWEDASVPPERLGEYLRKLRALFERYGYDCDLYGHFGQGCVHTRIDFDLVTAPGIATFRRFIHEAAELVVGLGGSISGEHGDGQSKGELLEIMYGPRLVRAFERFKAIWDPEQRMNPGKVVHPYRADQNLRLGTDYDPAPVQTVMHFAEDAGDFGRTLLRCVGVGECRKQDGTMCPSYKATMEERHSTRGRAHLLFEMLNGQRPDGVLRRGWQEPAVKEALDLCLSCKACRKECPVHVDMASYKAEFLAHYYQQHRRPVAAHLFGHIDRWSRWASRAPGLVNALSQNTALAPALKRVAGIAPQRQLPAFAARTFRQDFRAQAGPAPRGEVLLWPDTFNNHFHPQVAQAAARVLAHAGYNVRIPPRPLCCGRPLYEFGLLDDARAHLRQVVDTLDAELRAGIPVVVLEPACLSVFKVELPMMLPRDQQARRLQAQSVQLADLLAPLSEELPWQALNQPALLHAHCHARAVLALDTTQALLKALRLDAQMPDTGCCGMAGSFGFEAPKYEVSMQCAERRLLPAVRAAGDATLLIADGYSCREQIVQSTGREVLHLAEVLQRAIEGASP